ncbi:amino acid permease [Actinoallomurus purpureus]|uniref:amino acid permease n=1 Tax=Actinoallomurus purpureus TaxID=478114 RepID=UPI0020937F76|nr:amino acid permease [Actinoallomurus purpureus]MCO6005590.1 amino acid permease [Actinoallomurus purpureus]
MSVQAPFRNNLLRRLPVEETVNPNYGGRHRLSLVYKTRDLIVLGLGVMVGAGIFKIAGQQAATTAGPAVIVSFVIAGLACLLSALSYAELSSTMPVAGSAYSFTYVAFGEIWAWVIGWALMLELQLAAAVVGRAWSLYATQLITDLGTFSGISAIHVPASIAGVVGHETGFDLFALLILVVLAVVVAIGARLSLYALWFMVLAKVIAIGLVIAGGLLFFHPANLKPFVPPARPVPAGGDRTVLDLIMGGTPHAFGLFGIFAATSAIAFAYIGFDLIATAAEETQDAPRRVPKGMIVSLLIAIALYVGVAIAMVGMVPYAKLDPATPLASAFNAVGSSAMGLVIDVGAVIGLATVILVVMVAQTRVIFAMARDGLLPASLAVISNRYKVPTRAALVVGFTAIALSQVDVWTFGKVSVLTLQQMIVIGTLFAFLFVSAGVMALRRSRPDLPRGFRVPAVPVTPILAIGATAWLMLNLHLRTWEYFGVWMAFGLAVYLLYGRNNSRLRHVLDGRPMRVHGRHRR